MDKSAASAGQPLVWVTRPEPQATAHRKHLEAHGLRTTTSPVLTIEPLPLPNEVPEALEHYDAVLVTSLNAFDHLPGSWIAPLRDVPLFVSGATTHKRASELGFSQITASAGQGSHDIPPLVHETFGIDRDKTSLHLLYLAGTPRTPFLESVLSKTHSISVEEVYEAKLASSISDATLALIREGHVSATTLFSSRSAQQAAQLLQTASNGQIANAKKTILAVCMSPAVERVARQNGFVKTTVSDAQTSESVVKKLVDQLKN